jgi:C4-dicarboxylate-specific signal transduction histidine kinase
MTDKLQLLVVDDDEVDRLTVLQALYRSELEAQIQDVESLAGARSALRNRHFHCVILDYHLRDGQAIHLLEESKAGQLTLPPVIILTGSCSNRIAVSLMKAGAMDYLPKDELTPSRIAQSVRNALRVRESQDELAHAYEDLERRVIERTAELERANCELGLEISNRLKAEEQSRQHLSQLAHVARLSTLGEMAASLAHELNQPLGAVANYANGCLKRLETGTLDEKTLGQVLSHIGVQAERAGKIIHRLRSFVSRREPEMAVTDLNQLLLEVGALEMPDARQGEVEIEYKLAQHLPAVQADPIQIQQVALNLMRNGIEAVQTNARDLRKVTLETRSLGAHRVEASVSDTGPPCNPAVLEQMFEPFVTTKENGMGMGLTICRSIIEAHGGELWALPNPEGGLSLRFTLRVG